MVGSTSTGVARRRTSTLAAAFVVAGKDLRQRLRDRSAYLVGIVAPFALAAIFSTMNMNPTVHGDFVLVDEDRSAISESFRTGALAAIEQQGLASVDETDRSTALRLVDDGARDAAFVIPAGFAEAVQSGRGAHVDLYLAEQRTYDTLLAPAVAEAFADQLDSAVVSVALVRLSGDLTTPVEIITGRASASSLDVSLNDAPVELRQAELKTYMSAGMAVFFVLFGVQYAFLSLQAERRDGTLARIGATPVSPAAVLLGKSMVAFVVGVTSVGVLALGSTWLLGAHWGPPLGVVLLTVSVVLAAMGIMGVVTTFARTFDQATGLSSIVAVVLGLIGGSFFPTFLGPPLLGTLGRLTPHQWFLRGLGDLRPHDATWADALPSVLALVVIALVTGSLALWRARRMVAP